MARKPPSHKNRPARRKMTGSKTEGAKRSRVTAKPEQDDATRMMHKKVKTARGRKISSKLWIERQINDPFVR
jgi:23S rRNA (uridine2552-2'-O)-methyltransferase